MIAPKPKVQLSRKKKPPVDLTALESFIQTPTAQQEADDLFPDATPPPSRLDTATPWRGCAVCGADRKTSQRGAPGHEVCAGCLADPAAIVARLTTQRRAVATQWEQAWLVLVDAENAISEPERARWNAYDALRQRLAATLTEHERTMLQRTEAAYKTPDDPRIPATLRAMWHAVEGEYWARGARDEMTRRLLAQQAMLCNALEDAGRHEEAERYTEVKP